MRHVSHCLFRALLTFGSIYVALACLASCARTSTPDEAALGASEKANLKPALGRLMTSNLVDAYAGGSEGADAIYRGKRYTLVGQVVAVDTDAGSQRVVLGSKLKPVLVTGIDPSAAAALVVDAWIEIDCVVTGARVEIPNLDCGPNGQPRRTSATP